MPLATAGDRRTEGGEVGDAAWLTRFVAALEESPGDAFASPDQTAAGAWWTHSSCARTIIDRRGLGGLDVIVNIALQGRPVAVGVGHERRLAEIRARLRGLDATAQLQVFELSALAEVAAAWPTVILLDPPTRSDIATALSAGDGELHLAWTPKQAAAALTALERRFDLRGEVADLYRVMRDHRELPADQLAIACGGARRSGSGPEGAARALRILEELGLVEVVSSEGGTVLRHASSEQTSLEHSAAFRSYSALQEESRKFLISQTAEQ